jgi:hypothetical protein
MFLRKIDGFGYFCKLNFPRCTMNKLYWALAAFLLPIFTFAQSDGDYQSRATGPWFTATTWQVYFNGAFRNLEDASAGPYQNQIPNNPPSNGETVGEINIISPNSVTVDAAVSLDSNPLYIFSGAEVVISNTVANPDITVDVNSSIYVEGLLALANGATHSGFDNSTTTILNGGVYEHRYTTTRGVVIGATWDDGSTIRFTSYTNPGTFNGTENLDQDYYDFEWNCPQSGNIDLNGNLLTVRNNLSILATDTGTPSNERLRIFGASNDNTLTIGGDLILSGASSVAFTTNGTGNVIDVTGDYLASATIRTTFVFGTGSLDINLAGDYTQSGAVHRFTTNAAAIFNLNLTRDFSYGTSTMSATVGSQANLNFVSSATQAYTGTGTVTGPINYFVEGTTSLNLATSSLRGTGTFTLRSTASLQAGAFNGSGTNTAGAIQTGTTQGNIRVSGVRTYEDESTIIYNGAAAQQLGAGHPTATIVNTVIQNGLSVTTVGSRTISGDLTLVSGNLAIAGATALTLNRNIIPNSNFITPNTTSDLIINGDGLSGTFPFPAGAATIRNFTLNRSGGSLTFANNVTITALVTLTNGELDFSGRTLILNGTFTSAGGSLFSNSTTSVLQIGGSGAFGSLQMAGDPNNQVGTFTFARTTSGTLTNAGDLFVATTFNLNNGTFTNSGSLTFANGATLNRIAAAATIAGNRPTTQSGDTYNVVYTGGTITTSLELPDPSNDTDLGNITIASGTINLAQDLVINGIVNLNGGTFVLGTNTITMEGSAWNDNAGTFSVGTGTVIFNSTAGATIGGSSVPQFGNLTLNDNTTLTFPSGVINVSGDLQIGSSGILNSNNGTLTLNGATSTNFSGGGKTYRNITLNKTVSSDVTLTSGVNLTGLLTVTSNGSDFASNGNLTLISNASGTASIAQLLAGRTVSGDVVAQRYIAAKGRAYRDISAPVLNPTVQQLIQSGVTITGPFTGSSFPCAGCGTNNPSMYFYDETVAGLQSLGYTAFPLSGGNSATSLLVRGRGYNVLIRNELGSPTASLTGTINSGTIALPTSYTTTGGGATEDGWNFVGNPYPSAIDWDNAGWTKTNVTGNQISVYDPAKPPSGGYRVWNGAVGDLGNGRIASGQGFWFKASAAPTLQVTEATKTTTSTTFYRKAQTDVDYLQITLLGNEVEENAYIQKVEGAKMGYDEFDGFKLSFDEDVALSTLSEDGKNSLSINAIGEVLSQGEIPVQIKNLAVGTYTISLKRIGNFSESVILIRDNYLRTLKEFSGSYQFSVSSTPNSKSTDRFTLVFGQETPSKPKGSTTSLYPNPVMDVVNVEVFSKVTPHGEVMDLTGKVVGNLAWEKLEENIWRGSLNMNSAQNGMYIARIKFGAILETIKFIKK